MKKRIISALLCSALILTSLAGCGDKKTDDVESTTAKPEQSSSPVEKVTVHFSNFFVEGQEHHNLTEAAAKKFNEENDDAEIILDEMPHDPYLIQVNSLGTTGDLPELVMVNGSMMSAFSDTGVIIPLSDIV